MITASDRTMDALRVVRSLGLRSWCIGAGAIRSLVWDSLHGFEKPTAIQDWDVVYFDARAAATQDRALERRLREASPDVSWEVTNQANVHLWFASSLGQEVAPVQSLEEGVATWPEYATCVGAFLDESDAVRVVAPHGLEDLFEMKVRHNPARASFATYLERVVSKRLAERWPMLSIAG